MKDKQKRFIQSTSNLFTTYPVIPIILTMMVFFSIAAPYFLTGGNMQTILAANAVILIAAVGQTVVLLTGGIDLSVSTVISASAVVSGVVMAATGSVLLGLLVALLVGLVFGFLNGFMIGYLGLTPFITTMGTQLIARGLAFVLSKGIAVKGTPPWMIEFGFGSFLGLPYITLVAAAVVAVTAVLVSQSTWGRHVMLFGSNKASARYVGIKSKRIEASVYLLSGFLAGIAGFISIASLGNALPGVGDTLLLIIIGGVVLGGTNMSGGEGSVSRTVLGVGLLAILTSGLNMIGLPFYDQLIIQGILIFLGNSLAVKFSSKANTAMRY